MGGWVALIKKCREVCLGYMDVQNWSKSDKHSGGWGGGLGGCTGTCLLSGWGWVNIVTKNIFVSL